MFLAAIFDSAPSLDMAEEKTLKLSGKVIMPG